MLLGEISHELFREINALIVLIKCQPLSLYTPLNKKSKRE
jgi:hypothetical protein